MINQTGKRVKGNLLVEGRYRASQDPTVAVGPHNLLWIKKSLTSFHQACTIYFKSSP